MSDIVHTISAIDVPGSCRWHNSTSTYVVRRRSRQPSMPSRRYLRLRVDAGGTSRCIPQYSFVDQDVRRARPAQIVEGLADAASARPPHRSRRCRTGDARLTGQAEAVADRSESAIWSPTVTHDPRARALTGRPVLPSRRYSTTSHAPQEEAGEAGADVVAGVGIHPVDQVRTLWPEQGQPVGTGEDAGAERCARPRRAAAIRWSPTGRRAEVADSSSPAASARLPSGTPQVGGRSR